MFPTPRLLRSASPVYNPTRSVQYVRGAACSPNTPSTFDKPYDPVDVHEQR